MVTFLDENNQARDAEEAALLQEFRNAKKTRLSQTATNLKSTVSPREITGTTVWIENLQSAPSSFEDRIIGKFVLQAFGTPGSVQEIRSEFSRDHYLERHERAGKIRWLDQETALDRRDYITENFVEPERQNMYEKYTQDAETISRGARYSRDVPDEPTPRTRITGTDLGMREHKQAKIERPPVLPVDTLLEPTPHSRATTEWEGDTEVDDISLGSLTELPDEIKLMPRVTHDG